MHHSLVTVSVSNQQSHVVRFNIDIKRAIIQSNGSTQVGKNELIKLPTPAIPY